MASPYWRRLRERMREIAVELYMADHLGLDNFNVPEDAELRESGYMDRAKVLAFKEIHQSGSRHKTLTEARESGE